MYQHRPGGSVTKELYVANRKRAPENEDAAGKRKRVDADRKRINGVLMSPTKRAKTLKAGRERNATPAARSAAAIRKKTPVAQAAAAKRNATPEAHSASAKRNATPAALFLNYQRQAKPDALLMDRQRKARGSKIQNSAKTAAKVTEKNAKKRILERPSRLADKKNGRGSQPRIF